MQFEVLLCADWSGSPGGGREVYAAFPSSRVIRRLAPPPLGWTVVSVLEAADTWAPALGAVLIGFDAPVGMPRSLWDALMARGASGTNFAQWLDAHQGLDVFLDPVDAPEDWAVGRPFFGVLEGPGGRTRFEEAARTSGVEVLRYIDRRTGAKSPLIASGIPGVAGGSARDVWRGLKARRESPDPPLIWPFELSFADEPFARRNIVAEIYPRLASGIALGRGSAPWPIPAARPAPRRALAHLLGSEWVRQYGVLIAGHDGFEDSRDAFDALISAAALLRLVLEGLPLSDPAYEDRLAEGGMLGTGAVDWPDDGA